jgi:hypothetical protein
LESSADGLPRLCVFASSLPQARSRSNTYE